MKKLLQYSLLQHPALYCVLGGVLAASFHGVRAEWTGLVVLSALIFLYGFLSHGLSRESNRKVQLTPHEIGDNCYFIGFVYTLLVITSALILDASAIVSSADSKEALHPLLKTVGIALGTSVAGMLGRFVLTHGAEVPENEFDRITSNIAIAANKLSGTVKRIESETGKFASSLASWSKSMKVHSDTLVDETGKVGASLEKAAEKVMQSLSEQVSTMWEKTELTELSAALKKIIEDHRAGMAEISKIQETALQRLDDAVSTSIHSMEYAQTTTESLRDGVNDNLAGIGRVISGLDSNVERLAGSFQPLTEMHAALKGEVQDSLARVNEIRAKFDAALSDLLGDINSIKDLALNTNNINTSGSSITEKEQELPQSIQQNQASVAFYYRLLFALEIAAVIALIIILYLGNLSESSVSLRKLGGFAESVQTAITASSGDAV